jgi:heme-degrading monooxygenase HmoA
MIIGFGLFKFKEDSTQQGMTHLLEHLELEKRQSGNLEGYVARGLADTASFLIYTKWDSKESREAMHKSVRKDPETERRFSEIMKLVDKEPIFGAFEVIEHSSAH